MISLSAVSSRSISKSLLRVGLTLDYVWKCLVVDENHLKTKMLYDSQVISWDSMKCWLRCYQQACWNVERNTQLWKWVHSMMQPHLYSQWVDVVTAFTLHLALYDCQMLWRELSVIGADVSCKNYSTFEFSPNVVKVVKRFLPVWTKFVGLPIMERSIRKRWWRRRVGLGCCWMQQENSWIMISPVPAIFLLPGFLIIDVILTGFVLLRKVKRLFGFDKHKFCVIFWVVSRVVMSQGKVSVSKCLVVGCKRRKKKSN